MADNGSTRQISSIRERIFVAEFQPLSDEVFEQGLIEFESYCSALSKNLYKENKVNWNINIILNKNQIPEIDNKNSSLTFHTRYYSEKAQVGSPPKWICQVHKDKFVFNFCKNKLNDAGSFEEFMGLAVPAFLEFCNKFKVTEYKNLTLHYLMVINRLTVPDENLANPDWLEVKALATPFSAVPYPKSSDRYLPPFNTQQTWAGKIDGRDILYFCETKTPSPSHKNKNTGPEVDIQFIAKHTSIVNVTTDYRMLFDAITELYDIILTDQAKTLFGKEDWK